MNTASEMRAGDYAKRFPKTSAADKDLARQLMRRQGCKSIRFETTPQGELVAHGYVARFEGANVEPL